MAIPVVDLAEFSGDAKQKASFVDALGRAYEDVGFVEVGQTAQIKLVTYPFQKYGMLTGKVIHVSEDANEATKSTATANSAASNERSDSTNAGTLTYKARIRLNQQLMRDPQGTRLALTPGMQLVAEVNQGKRSVLEYLLSPVQKIAQEAARER